MGVPHTIVVTRELTPRSLNTSHFRMRKDNRIGTYLETLSLLLLLLLQSIRVQAQTDCTLPSVALRYGLSQPVQLNPSSGSHIGLTCIATGVTEYIWQKNGQVINGSSSGTFTIPSIGADDGGVYQCGVEVPACSLTAYSDTITINTIPSISFLIGESTVMEGEVITLSCLAQGWPTPTITWLFNGSTVHQGSIYTIASATRANEGDYECQASNSRGDDVMVHPISVVALPSPSTLVPSPLPTSSVQVTEVSTTAATVSNGQTPTSTPVIETSTKGNQFNTQVASGSDNVTDMGLTTATSTLFLPDLKAPFIIVLVLSALLAIGVGIIIIIMGSMCCSEVCRVYKRRAKLRRDRLNSDEISLLPTQGNDRQEVEGVDGQGYGNMLTNGPSCVNMGFKDVVNGSDMSAQNSSERLPHNPTAALALQHTEVKAQRYSADENNYTVGVFEKKQKHHGTDREQLITQSISTDDTQTSEQKKNQRENERSRSRPKSEGATQEYSDTVTSSKPRPASVSGPAAKENKVTNPSTNVLVDIPQELPISEASMASLTVTAVIKAKDEGNGEIDESEVGGRTSITISEKTGETTVVMEQEDADDLSSDDEWETSRISTDSAQKSQEGSEPESRMSTLSEKARKLGRTTSYVQLLSSCKVQTEQNGTAWGRTVPMLFYVSGPCNYYVVALTMIHDLSHPMDIVELSQLVYGTENAGRSHPLFMEYQSVPSNSVQYLDLTPEEMGKNRYRNVLPNPHSRVPLNDLGVPGSTYINANYIRGFGNEERKYIASQGPKFETMEDFWRMVWEKRVSIIIMITGIVERGVNKCAKYWPSSQKATPTSYGNITVRNNFEENTSSSNISYLTISSNNDPAATEREVYHFWCTAWPDFGVPNETAPILKLRQMVEDYRCQGVSGPLLIHCSAGLGRTGTFIAIDMGIQQYESEAKVDPLRYIGEMRQDRGGIIQTPEQYLFVHKALADYMTTRPQ